MFCWHICRTLHLEIMTVFTLQQICEGRDTRNSSDCYIFWSSPRNTHVLRACLVFFCESNSRNWLKWSVSSWKGNIKTLKLLKTKRSQLMDVLALFPFPKTNSEVLLVMVWLVPVIHLESAPPPPPPPPHTSCWLTGNKDCQTPWYARYLHCTSWLDVTWHSVLPRFELHQSHLPLHITHYTLMYTVYRVFQKKRLK